MENKKLILLSTLILVLSVSFALALHVLTPATYDDSLGYSYNETITTNVFNITVNNTFLGAIANITQVNITLPATFTYQPLSQGFGENETHVVFSSTTTVLSWTNASTNYFLINGTEVATKGNWTYFWFNASATTPGDYNITVTTVNGTHSLEQNISVQINDTTAPKMTFGGTTPVANANRSATTIPVNITVNDSDGAYAGNLSVFTVNYYIYNSSGLWNNTNTTINSNLITFVGLIDGTYYINSTANDTLGNTNTTGAETRTIILDTTAPGTTAACTPTSVSLTNTVTCTCAGTDTLSGVASSTATSTPATASTGTYHYTCEVTDYAGNSASSTTSYQVTGGSSDGPGGSGTTTTSFWTKGTRTVTAEEFQNSYTEALSVRRRLKVKVETLNHYVGVTELTATTATINVSSDPQEATLIVGDERMFEVSGDDYYDILVKLNSIESSKANITVQSIHELVTEDTTEGEEGLEDAGDTAAEEDKAAAAKIENLWWYIGGVVVIILVIIGIIYAKKK